MNRRDTVIALPALLAAVHARAQALAAPNVVEIRPDLVTSGQPAASALAGLARHGFKAVIYLAPSTVGDAVRTEPELVTGQGLAFVHLPIPFGSPTEAHFESFSAALQRWQGQKVLVHCQVNMRASTLVFLHRVIKDRENPEAAWASVTRVWTPEGPWKQLVVSLLARHGIAFDPF